MEINKRALWFWLILFGYVVLFYFDVIYIRELTGMLLLGLLFSTIGLIMIDSIFRKNFTISTMEKIMEFFNHG